MDSVVVVSVDIFVELVVMELTRFLIYSLGHSVLEKLLYICVHVYDCKIKILCIRMMTNR